MAKIRTVAFSSGARGNEEPTDFHVWAGNICESGFNLHILRGFLGLERRCLAAISGPCREA